MFVCLLACLRATLLPCYLATLVIHLLIVNFSSWTRKFADALECPELSDLKNCAMKKSISEIITAQLKVNSTMLLAPFAPVVDGNVLEGKPIVFLSLVCILLLRVTFFRHPR